MSLLGGPKKINVLTKGQKKNLQGINSLLQDNLNVGMDAYGGTVTPGASALQNQVFQQGGGAMLGAAGQSSSAISDMLAGRNATGFNDADYFQNSVLNPAKQAFNDEQRQMEAKYGGSWGQTGGYQDAMQKGVARFGVGLGQQMSDYALNNRNEANRNRLSGVQGSLAQSQNLADTYQNMLNFGGDQRAIDGQQKGEAYNKWQSEQAYNNPWLSLMGPALGTQAFAVGQQQGALGAATGAANAVTGLIGASDIRVKKNIARIGSSPSGIPIYAFEYRDGLGPDGRFEGVMAHELVGANADAVVDMPNGYLGVNYSMIDTDFRQVG